jgi:long-chain fatty acid transport protein
MSMRLVRPAHAALAAALVLVPALTRASGFSIYEQGGRAMGFSGAYTAITTDPSAIFHNAAGIAFLKGKHIYVGGTLVAPSSKFTGDDPFPGAGRLEQQDVGIIPVPALYYTQQLSERLVVGLGVFSPYGLKTQWQNPDTFSGRFVAIETSLKGFSVNPTVAYKLADRLSVGVGLDLRFSKVLLRRRIPAVDPFTQAAIDVAEVSLESDYNTGLGFDVGVVAKPTERLSVGAQYRHKVKIDYTGSAAFTLIPTGNSQLDGLVKQSLPSSPADVTTAIEFPSTFSAGVAYDWDKWTVTADVVRFGWSSFAQLALSFPGNSALDQVIPENYTDIWQFRAGIERRLGESWAVRAGYHHDQTPVPAASVSPLLPDNDRNGLALGTSWVSRSGSFRLDAGFWYLFIGTRSTEGLNRDSYNGTYDNSAVTFGLSLGYGF